jgi:hypothetical protein
MPVNKSPETLLWLLMRPESNHWGKGIITNLLCADAKIIENLATTLQKMAAPSIGATVGSFESIIDTIREYSDKMESLINESIIEAD